MSDHPPVLVGMPATEMMWTRSAVALALLDTDVHVGHLGVHPFGLGEEVREQVIRKEPPDPDRS